jgi:hypothetical protein
MNASCTNVRELIPLFPDDLDTNETAMVREHVARCTECAAELGVYASQAAVFAQVREGREKVDLFSGIQAKLAQPEARGEIVRVTFGARALFAAAAAGVVIAFGLFSLLQPQQPVQPDKGVAHVDPRPVTPNKTPDVRTPGTNQTPGVLVNDPKTNDRRAPRARNPRRRIFDAGDGALPFFGGNDKRFVGGGAERELLPLDEEAEIPSVQPRKRHFQAPSAQPNTPKSGDDESLRF